MILPERDFLLVGGVSEEQMKSSDEARREAGMKPLWEDE